MNLFIKEDERIHFSFDHLNFVGEMGITLIFSPEREFAESELKNITDSLLKIFPLIGKKTTSQFYVFNSNLKDFPKTFTSKLFIGVEGFFKLFTEYTFTEKE